MTVTPKKTYRICIVSEQLAGGGAERCSAVLSQFFVRNNCTVHHVIVIDKVEYEFAGEILNLGKLKKGTFNFGDRFTRFKVLSQFFKNNTFDFIIDTRVVNRQWQEFFINKFIYNAPTIKMVHSFMTELYFPKNSFLSKSIFTSNKKIIAVSKAIKQKISANYKYKQVATIYNSVDFDAVKKQLNEVVFFDYDFILAVGNMNTNIKQFDVLINCYAHSQLPKNKIKLVILGDGSLKSSYEQLVKNLNLEADIIFKGTITNPFPFYANALFSVLTSKNEGFPTVLIESLACETPVVSFNCQSGPSEIITNYDNGILVENQNQEQMITAMNEMISNKNLYLHCKNNAKKSVEKFSLETIGKQWLQLFNSLQ